MDIVEELLKKLEILANIKEGQTISTYGTLSIIEHNAWSTTVWRKYAGENRQKTVENVKGILDDAMDHIDNIVVRNMVIKAMQGVANLKVTYKNDFKIVDFIITMLSSYDALLEPVDDTIEDTKECLEDMIQIIHEEDLGEKYDCTIQEDIKKEEENRNEDINEDMGTNFLSNVLKKDYVKVEKYLYDGYNVNVRCPAPHRSGRVQLHLRPLR